MVHGLLISCCHAVRSSHPVVQRLQVISLPRLQLFFKILVSCLLLLKVDLVNQEWIIGQFWLVLPSISMSLPTLNAVGVVQIEACHVFVILS